MYRWLLLLLLVTGFHRAAAQCRENAIGILDVNKAKVVFQNNGSMFWDRYSGQRTELPKGGGMTPSDAGNIFVGGLDPQGGLHTAVWDRVLGSDWYAGPSNNGTTFACGPAIETSSDIKINGIKRLSNGKVLILTTTQVLLYNLQTQQLDSTALPAQRGSLSAIELPDGRVMLLGDDFYPTKNPVLFLDTLTLTFSGGPTLQWFHKESSMNVLNNGKVLIAGVVGCEVYDPVTNLSVVVPDMLWPRMKHATAKLPNGDIMAFGGGSGLNGSGLTLVTQYFDDTLGYWFPGPSLGTGRKNASVTLLPDGRLLICGGNGTAAATEFYDPATNTVTAGSALLSGSEEQYVGVIDSQTVVVGSTFSNLFSVTSYLYKFNFQTGQTEEIVPQRAGAKMILVSPSAALAEVDHMNHLHLIDFELGLQSRKRWQRVWKLDRTEIDAFRSDFLANSVDFSHYPDIETWPAHGEVSLGEDRNLAPFVDVNQDGLYRPGADGDYPCIVGDQAIWFVFNDVGPYSQIPSDDLQMQVEAMAYAVDCQQTTCPDTNLAYATFLHLEFTNQSNVAYHDLYVSNLQDVEIGEGYDDHVVCDTSLELAIGYNGYPTDPVYPSSPPAWGTSVLPNAQLSEMSGMMRWGSGLLNPAPFIATQYYDYMRSIWPDGQHLVNNGNDGHPNNGVGPLTNFLFPSTDGFCSGAPTGWNENYAGNSTGDRNFLQSVGPFDLQPGEQKQLDLAFIYARHSSNLASVCALKSSTATIRDWWQNQLDRGCFNTVVGREEPQIAQAFRVYPNPSGDGHVTLDLGKALSDNGRLEVLDMQGRRLQVLALPAGAQRNQVQLHDLAAGIYLLRFQDETRAETQRLVIQH